MSRMEGEGASELIADRFAIERRAGAGGMGVVFRAVDRWSGVLVALKFAAVEDDQLRARAIAEAEALAALDHPAIVRHVAHGLTPDGRPFLAMEWLEGEDLAARLQRAPLTAREAALLGSRVAGALAAAHARGVVHRDIKPSNLFLPGGDVARVKLVDFGIARAAQPGPRLTATGMLLGTPGYMAPEQATGEREIGPPADLFALGAVVFECLAGQPAFPGPNAIAVLARVLLDEPRRLDAVRLDLPLALIDLVAHLLAKSPADRPLAAAAAAALAALLPVLDCAAASQPAPLAEALTAAEQHLLCVLLARPAQEPPSAATTMPERVLALDPLLARPAQEPPSAATTMPERVLALDALDPTLAVLPAGGPPPLLPLPRQTASPGISAAGRRPTCCSVRARSPQPSASFALPWRAGPPRR